MTTAAAVQIVQMPPHFVKVPSYFFGEPNNRKKPLHLLYLHSRKPVFAMFEGVQP